MSFELLGSLGYPNSPANANPPSVTAVPPKNAPALPFRLLATIVSSFFGDVAKKRTLGDSLLFEESAPRLHSSCLWNTVNNLRQAPNNTVHGIE